MERLIIDSINELAESLGHSFDHPLSVSLLCLNHGIDFEKKGKIFVEFNQIIKHTAFDDLDLSLFKQAMIKIHPESVEFSDIVISAFVKAYARLLIPELYPYSMTL